MSVRNQCNWHCLTKSINLLLNIVKVIFVGFFVSVWIFFVTVLRKYLVLWNIFTKSTKVKMKSDVLLQLNTNNTHNNISCVVCETSFLGFYGNLSEFFLLCDDKWSPTWTRASSSLAKFPDVSPATSFSKSFLNTAEKVKVTFSHFLPLAHENLCYIFN